MKRATRRIVPLWLLVVLGAAVASGAVLYTYQTTTFTATIVENVGVWGVMENTNFQIPDNGAANIKYTVYNQSGETKTLTLISNVDSVTEDRLWYACAYPWPTSANKVWADGVNYGFTLNSGQSLELKVTVGDAGPAVPGNSWNNLQLYLMDNALY
ncbi:MAG: hypothetical protein QXR15_02820 [Candidatus Hadarchaeales archaeon]